MAQKFLVRKAGKTQQGTGVIESEGVASAGGLVALDEDGKLNLSVLPTGVGADVYVLTASESLNTGSLVNVFTDGGSAKVRLADNSNGREANGYVKESVSAAGEATVYPLDGVNPHLSGLVAGSMYWLGVAGGVINTPLDSEDDNNTGKVCQMIGKAVSAEELVTDDYGFVIL